MSPSAIDFSDVQGLVRYGYGDLTEACFLLLSIENPPATRTWLATVNVSAAAEGKASTAMQIAFTSQGLQSLGVSQDVLGGFSAEFLSGMAGEESRLRRLGDVGANAASGWRWGRPGHAPDVLVMLYAGKGCLKVVREELLGRLSEIGLRLLDCLNTADLDGYEPFGFRDGISQPKIDWNRERTLDGDQLEYGNLLAVGEFLLGYPNEYREYTDRPLLDVKDDPKDLLLPAEDQPDKRDLGRNGTYLVFRQLEQDVRGFWRFLDQQANSDPEQRRKLGEAMVGRTMLGQPLVPLASCPIPGVGPKTEETSQNQFTYESDKTGVSCSFGAHVRRANPRNADLPGGRQGLFSRLIRTFGFRRDSIRDDLTASTRFHRLLRRGREYGTELLPADAVRADKPDGEGRGIHFICLNANIARQFEFVQNAWMIDTKFDGLTEESDPLLGNREPVSGCSFTNTFSLPQKNAVRRRIAGVPRFVTVRGGAYFFLPGLRALRYLATLGN